MVKDTVPIEEALLYSSTVLSANLHRKRGINMFFSSCSTIWCFKDPTISLLKEIFLYTPYFWMNSGQLLSPIADIFFCMGILMKEQGRSSWHHLDGQLGKTWIRNPKLREVSNRSLSLTHPQEDPRLPLLGIIWLSEGEPNLVMCALMSIKCLPEAHNRKTEKF